MREATDRYFHLLLFTESNTDTINIREPAEASKIEMKRKWQGTIKEEDYPTDVEDLTDEDPEDMDEEELELDVDTLEDVLIIVEECSETLGLLHNTISTQAPELLQFLQTSCTTLSQLARSVSRHLRQTTITTSSTKSS